MLKETNKENEMLEQEKFMIGADPEFFLADKNDKLKSAIPYITGTKHAQMMVDGGGIQRDNVAAEFSCDPQDSEEGFVGIIEKMLKQLSSHVKPLKLKVLASTDFPVEELNCLEAREFGCDPDFDCYALAVNSIGEDAAVNTLRSCGGHIHIGVNNGYPKVLSEDEDYMGRIKITKAMDFFVGIPSIIIDPDETAPRRRKLYGKAGCHRPKDYGVEYRAVGNFWTRSPDTVRLIYRLTAMAIKACDMGVAEEYLNEVGEKEVQRIINESDKAAAEKVVDMFIKKHMKEETADLFLKCKNNPLDINEQWGL